MELTPADLDSARRWILQKKVGLATFSEGNYQVEVLEGKKQFFPFLHLDDEGHLINGFCGCDSSEEKGSCPHLAAGYLKILNAQHQPLHVRFRSSFWNQLGKIAYERYGDTLKALKKKGKSWKAISVMQEEKLLITPKTKQSATHLKEILDAKNKLSEETSLKFSNFSPEEISLWKQGKPSPDLAYALSFWSDLAKWWIQLAESDPQYQVIFEGSPLPLNLQIQFKGLDLAWNLSATNLEELIPYLKEVPSPLKVYALETQEIASITYNPEQKNLFIQKKSLKMPPSPGGIEKITLSSFWYLPSHGFFPKTIDPLLTKDLLSPQEMKRLFEKHEALLKNYLHLHPESLPAKYDLFFDSFKNLHILTYVFEPGDLQKERSLYLGPWVYLENKGFYHLHNLLFDGIQKIVPREHLASFINHNRIFLNQHSGFQTHISSIESTLNYSVDAKGTLHFTSSFDLAGDDWIDLGEWIYLKDKGFFAKRSHKITPLLETPLSISPKHISAFIHERREELEAVSGFFTPHTPIDTGGLKVLLTEEKQILLEPSFTLAPRASHKNVHFFGDFTFVEGEGFCEIPHDKKLPTGYEQKRLISSSDESFFIHYELENLRPYFVSIDPALEIPKKEAFIVEHLEEVAGSNPSLWKVSLFYQTEVGKVSLHTLWKAAQENKRYLFTEAGLILLKQPRFFFLKYLSKDNWQEDLSLNISTLDWIRLSLFGEIIPSDATEDDQTRKLLSNLTAFEPSLPLDLTGLKSDLRSYQETGVKWLFFLYVYGLSGLLCDEMGLGKTHQAMALIAAANNKDQKQKYLVVCPTSVIYHWEELLKRFLPHLPVHTFHGLKRTLPLDDSQASILLTSYGIARSEKETLEKIPFAIAIFDEIQIAKNASSQTHKALKQIKARTRLGLTGTPIENHLLELKTLFDLILPGYMPSESLFRDLFVSKDPNDPKKTSYPLLSRLIHPFILRRRKKEVLLELPEKVEEIAYCDLSPEQTILYKKYFLEHKENLLKDLQNKEHPLAYTHIFSLISHLKQICDHPCLITKNTHDFQKHASGKWDLFLQLLQETRDSGQKLVVFSQYLGMLTFIETYLKEKGIGFAAIRGSTHNRKEQLEKFKTDPQCEVFVASLQAVGVGVDLVSASVVIHYDRWWNPARENQATDRVHRIGQHRGVQVFKMVTKNTIEEYIHRLIERKIALTEGVLNFDEQDQIKSLSREEILEILTLIDKNL